jgi:hypothetical protein
LEGAEPQEADRQAAEAAEAAAVGTAVAAVEEGLLVAPLPCSAAAAPSSGQLKFACFLKGKKERKRRKDIY